MINRQAPKTREDLFKYIQSKEYNKVIEFLKSEPKEITQDSIVREGLKHFFNELLTGSRDIEDQNYLFGQLFNLHTSKPPFYTFSQEHLETIIIFLSQTAKKPEEGNFYASQLPDNPICAKIISDYKASKPVLVKHENDTTIRVNSVLSDNPNLTKSIFNSKQERLFFIALRNCFPTHFIYPNSALSTIIDISHIENKITPTERRFFYNTTIDFILVDQFDDFKPIVAIELDSEWHRLHNQQERDESKNKIIKASGLPLYRIEHLNRYKTLEDFEKVILSTVLLKPRES